MVRHSSYLLHFFLLQSPNPSQYQTLTSFCPLHIIKKSLKLSFYQTLILKILNNHMFVASAIMYDAPCTHFAFLYEICNTANSSMKILREKLFLLNLFSKYVSLILICTSSLVKQFSSFYNKLIIWKAINIYIKLNKYGYKMA